MKKVAVVLSGSGVFDGAELHESVLTLLELDKREIAYQCMAPNIEQAHVINHLTGEVSEGETRNVLVESARIARGEILDLAEVKAEDYAAFVFPGGFGVAKNLCDFAFKGADCTVQEDVLRVVKEAHAAKLPLGFICIAPAMMAKIAQLSQIETQLTIGTDADTAEAIQKMGVEHIACPVEETVVDEANLLVTTPAYMLAGRIREAHEGITKLVETLQGWLS